MLEGTGVGWNNALPDSISGLHSPLHTARERVECTQPGRGWGGEHGYGSKEELEAASGGMLPSPGKKCTELELVGRWHCCA